MADLSDQFGLERVLGSDQCPAATARSFVHAARASQSPAIGADDAIPLLRLRVLAYRSTLVEMPSWFDWISFAIGVAGIAITVFAIPRKRLRYFVETIPLIGSAGANFPAEVEITFSGQKVPNLSRTNIYIWNAGNRSLRAEDIASADPVHLLIGDIKNVDRIHDLRVAKVTRPVTKFDVDGSPLVGDFGVTFEFLDPKDGGVIEVLHSDAAIPLRLAGTIKGSPRGIREARPRFASWRKSEWVDVTRFALLGVVGMATYNARWFIRVPVLLALAFVYWADLSKSAATYPSSLRLK